MSANPELSAVLRFQGNTIIPEDEDKLLDLPFSFGHAAGLWIRQVRKAYVCRKTETIVAAFDAVHKLMRDYNEKTDAHEETAIVKMLQLARKLP